MDLTKKLFRVKSGTSKIILPENISEKARAQIEFSADRIENLLGFKFLDAPLPEKSWSLFFEKILECGVVSTRVREIFTSLEMIFENFPENGDRNLRAATRGNLGIILFRLAGDPLDRAILKILEIDAREIFGEVRGILRKLKMN